MMNVETTIGRKGVLNDSGDLGAADSARQFLQVQTPSDVSKWLGRGQKRISAERGRFVIGWDKHRTGLVLATDRAVGRCVRETSGCCRSCATRRRRYTRWGRADWTHAAAGWEERSA